MYIPLIVHCDPRKTKRSSTVLVAPGKYTVIHNIVDSEIELVTGSGSNHKLDSSKNEIEFNSVTSLFLKLNKIGQESHITIGLINGLVS